MSKRYSVRSTMRPDASRRRALVVAISLTVWMFIIGARLLYLQTTQHELLSARARAQQQSETEVAPERGLILDRTGRELARSIETESFFAVPSEIDDVDKIARRISPLVDIETATLAAHLKQAKEAKRKFAWIARKVDAEQAAKIRSLNLKGIYARKESKRHYPNGELASHVLGFVGLDETGLGGVEQFQNASLGGEAGKILLDRDARGQAYESFNITPRDGQSVVLTIDQTIQYKTEQALSAAVARARAKSGTAIVIEPQTGEILALANAPAFNPNEATRISAETRTNQALQNIYEPGSTFKIVAFSAALEEKLARAGDRIDCQMGAIKVFGRIVNDHAPFGVLTLTEALAKSSNVAAIKLGLRVGNERMYDYIKRFGFGARTGVELPGETAGLLRPVNRWQASSMGSIAMGQEVGVTPLQMVSAFAALANDGVRIAPHLVREIHDSDGTIIKQTKPDQHRVISRETAKTIRQMLESVTIKGTAKAARLDGYTAAGKTGTAQKIDPKTKAYSKTKHIASFVGFAPVSNPSVAIIVVIDEPMGAYHGGDVAAPVFREIAESVLPYLNVAPDTEFKTTRDTTLDQQLIAQNSSDYTSAAKESESNPTGPTDSQPEAVIERNTGGSVREVVYAMAGDRSLLMPDLRGRSVRDALRICAQLGLELEARGEGRALKQFPSAGEKIRPGQAVRVEFARSD